MAHYIFFILLTTINIKYARVLSNKVLIFQEPLCFLETSEKNTTEDGLINKFISLSRVTTKFKFAFADDKPLKQLIGSPYTEIKQFDYILMKKESLMFDQEHFIYTFQEKIKKLNFQFWEPEFLYLYPEKVLKYLPLIKAKYLDYTQRSSCFVKKKSTEVKKILPSIYSNEGFQRATHQRDICKTITQDNKLNIKNFLTQEVYKVQVLFLDLSLKYQKSPLFALHINKRNNDKPVGQKGVPRPNITWLKPQRINSVVDRMFARIYLQFRDIKERINNENPSELISDTTNGQTNFFFKLSIPSFDKGGTYNAILESGFRYALTKTKRLITLYRKNENSKKALEVFFKIKNVGRIFKEPKYIQNTTSSPGRRSGFLCWILGVVSAFFFLTFLFLRVHVSEKTRKGLSKKSKKSSNLSKRPIRKPLPSSAHRLKSKRVLFCFGLFLKREKAETIELKPNEKSDAPKHKDIDSDIKRLVSFLEEHLTKNKIDYNKKPRTYWEKSQKKLSWMEEGLFYKLGISETLVLKSQEEGHTVKFDENGPYIFYKPPVEKTHVRDYNFYNLLKAYLNGDKANMFRGDFDLSYYFDICNGLRIIIIQMVRYIKEDFPSEKKDASDATPLLGCSQHRNELFTSLENFLDHMWTKEFEFIENYVYSSGKARRRLALFMTEANLTLINTLESRHGLRKPKMFIKLLQWFKKLKRTVKI